MSFKQRKNGFLILLLLQTACLPVQCCLNSIGRDIGLKASEQLSNPNITIKLDVSDNVLQSIKYISMAIGFTGGILCVAIVVCLGTKLSCCKGNKTSPYSQNNHPSVQQSDYKLLIKDKPDEIVYVANLIRNQMKINNNKDESESLLSNIQIGKL